MAKRRISFFSLLFLVVGYTFLCPFDLETFGYYENRFFVLGSGKLSFQNLSENFSLGDYNRLRQLRIGAA